MQGGGAYSAQRGLLECGLEETEAWLSRADDLPGWCQIQSRNQLLVTSRGSWCTRHSSLASVTPTQMVFQNRSPSFSYWVLSFPVPESEFQKYSKKIEGLIKKVLDQQKSISEKSKFEIMIKKRKRHEVGSVDKSLVTARPSHPPARPSHPRQAG